MKNKFDLIKTIFGDWGLGIGDCGDWGLANPHPQSPIPIPIPNPQSP